jgi:hypothetical protein
MNYFAHGQAFVDQPMVLAGTALPDWLSVVDRRARARSHVAAQWVGGDDPHLAALATGVLRHHADDAWFHKTPAFTQLSLEFTCQVRDCLGQDAGFRPYFLGHILVEILLDDSLIRQNPQGLEAYYRAIDQIDATTLQAAVERIVPRPVPNLGEFLRLFSQERFLWDYADNAKLLFRLNQVMRRVGLPTLPPHFAELFGGMREQVTSRADELYRLAPLTCS